MRTNAKSNVTPWRSGQGLSDGAAACDKIGRSVRYRLDVLAYERNNLLRSTSDGQNVDA